MEGWMVESQNALGTIFILISIGLKSTFLESLIAKTAGQVPRLPSWEWVEGT